MNKTVIIIILSIIVLFLGVCIVFLNPLNFQMIIFGMFLIGVAIISPLIQIFFPSKQIKFKVKKIQKKRKQRKRRKP